MSGFRSRRNSDVFRFGLTIRILKTYSNRSYNGVSARERLVFWRFLIFSRPKSVLRATVFFSVFDGWLQQYVLRLFCRPRSTRIVQVIRTNGVRRAPVHTCMIRSVIRSENPTGSTVIEGNFTVETMLGWFFFRMPSDTGGKLLVSLITIVGIAFFSYFFFFFV